MCVSIHHFEPNFSASDVSMRANLLHKTANNLKKYACVDLEKIKPINRIKPNL